MIYDRQLLSPDLKVRTVKRKLSLFRDESGALPCTGLHFMQNEHGIVCAEGAELISALPAGVDEIFTSKGHAERIYLHAGRNVTLLGSEEKLSVPADAKYIVYKSEDEEGLFCVSPDGLYRASGGGPILFRDAPGGNCGCVAGERLFTASDETIAWSEPLNPRNWQTGLKESGRISFPSSEGKILDLFPLGNKVVLVRERGITLLSLHGDPLSFRAERLSVPFVGVVPDSAALCGDCIVFFARDGLYSFDGSLTRLSGCGASEVDAERGIKAVSSGGRYAAIVTLKSGEKCLWIVETAQKRGHFLRVRADMIGGGEEIVYAEEGKLFRIKGQGVPALGRRECTLVTEPSAFGLSSRKKYLDAISIEGSGIFYAEARAERGRARFAVGEAGERLKFSSSVPGTSFSINLRTESDHARISSITLELREDAWK